MHALFHYLHTLFILQTIRLNKSEKNQWPELRDGVQRSSPPCRILSLRLSPHSYNHYIISIQEPKFIQKSNQNVEDEGQEFHQVKQPMNQKCQTLLQPFTKYKDTL